MINDVITLSAGIQFFSPIYMKLNDSITLNNNLTTHTFTITIDNSYYY